MFEKKHTFDRLKKLTDSCLEKVEFLAKCVWGQNTVMKISVRIPAKSARSFRTAEVLEKSTDLCLEKNTPQKFSNPKLILAPTHIISTCLMRGSFV